MITISTALDELAARVRLKAPAFHGSEFPTRTESTMYVTLRRTDGAIIAEGYGRTLHATVPRLYNETLPAGTRRRHMALCTQHGDHGPYHVQMGYSLPGGGTTLDPLIVVQIA